MISTRGVYVQPLRSSGTPQGEELRSCCFVPPALHQDIQHVPVLINGTPQIVLIPVDFQEDFIQLPLIARLRTSPPEVIGIRLAEHHPNTIPTLCVTVVHPFVATHSIRQSRRREFEPM